MRITGLRTTVIATVAVATVAAAAVAASAATFDPAAGGFVGKGEVAQPWGWNNLTANTEAGRVTFSWSSSDTYAVTCEWWTGPDHNRKRHDVTVPKKVKVEASVAYEQRKNKQLNLTGFVLERLGATATDPSSAVPVPGGDCPNGGDGTITDVQLTSSNAGVLTAEHPSHDDIELQLVLAVS